MNLVITGLMGSGKSTIGQLAAKKLERAFIDTDQYLNENYGSAEGILSLPDGDARFREIEMDIAYRLSFTSDLVISTGGRFRLNQVNIDLLKRNAYILCLSADLDDLVYRLLNAKADTYRPRFFRAEDKQALMSSLERQSAPYYRQWLRIS
jgi:shikimate kinase